MKLQLNHLEIQKCELKLRISRYVERLLHRGVKGFRICDDWYM